MKFLASQFVATCLAFSTIAWFTRTFGPKNTAITCAYCGHPVPMNTATEGGIGAVNLAMRQHIEQCEGHPLKLARSELNAARSAMKVIYEVAACRTHSDAQRHLQALEQIGDIAGRNF